MGLCKGCGGDIPPARATQARYCSIPCRKRTFRLNHLEESRRAVREANQRRYARDPEYRRNQVAKTRAWNHRMSYGKVMNDPLLMHKDRYRRARAEGYRSGLEVAVARQLEAAGIQFGYETLTIPFEQPQKKRKYKPDIVLPNGIVVELKGRFVTADRQKHLMVKEQFPDLDVRLVFSNPNQRISKQSKTTYAVWAESKGFKYAKVSVPVAWINEPVNKKSLAVIQRFAKEKD